MSILGYLLLLLQPIREAGDLLQGNMVLIVVISVCILLVFMALILAMHKNHVVLLLKRVPISHPIFLLLLLVLMISKVGLSNINHFILVAVYYTATLLVFSTNGWNNMVRYYYNLSVIFSVVAVLQEVIFLISGDIYTFRGNAAMFGHNVAPMLWNNISFFIRTPSFFSEPSHFLAFIGPAIMIAIIGPNIFFVNKNVLFRLLILLVPLISNSTLGYLVIIASILVIIFEKKMWRNIKGILIFFCLMMFLLLFSGANWFQKIYDLFYGWDIHNTASSSYTIIMIKYILLDFIENPTIFGWGYGSFSEWVSNKDYAYNSYGEDGTSFGVARIVVEFGVVGLLCMLYMCIFGYALDKKRLVFIIPFVFSTFRWGAFEVPLFTLMIFFIIYPYTISICCKYKASKLIF